MIKTYKLAQNNHICMYKKTHNNFIIIIIICKGGCQIVIGRPNPYSNTI